MSETIPPVRAATDDTPARKRRPLTPKQRRLGNHLHALLHILDLDPRHIAGCRYESARERTVAFENAIEYIVRSTVVMDHVWMDDTLAIVLQAHLKNRGRLTPVARMIGERLTQRVYLSQKLDIVADVMEVPKAVQKTIRALNDLRNTVAHELVIDKGGAVIFKGHDLLAQEGFSFYMGQIREARKFFDPEVRWFLNIPEDDERPGGREIAPP